MNRKYKFRGKNTFNNEWVYGSLVVSGKECYIVPEGVLTDDVFSFRIKVIPETVGEATDFRDDNDNEVYEDDIVDVGYGVGKVIYHFGCFMIEWIDDPEANMELLTMRKMRARESLKVKGNIHDNPPQLIEKQ